jgi:hypothetical protein
MTSISVGSTTPVHGSRKRRERLDPDDLFAFRVVQASCANVWRSTGAGLVDYEAVFAADTLERLVIVLVFVNLWVASDNLVAIVEIVVTAITDCATGAQKPKKRRVSMYVVSSSTRQLAYSGVQETKPSWLYPEL